MGSPKPRGAWQQNEKLITKLSEHKATPKWSLGPKPALKQGQACERFRYCEKDATPGPGAYDCGGAVPSPRPNRPSWGFGGKSLRNFTGLQRAYWPQIPSKTSTSPGQYSPKDTRRPDQTIGRDPRDKEPRCTPGPGDWSPRDSAGRRQTPQWSMRPRPDFFWGYGFSAKERALARQDPIGGHVRVTEKSVVPGPGAYQCDPVSARSPREADYFMDITGELEWESSPRTVATAGQSAWEKDKVGSQPGQSAWAVSLRQLGSQPGSHLPGPGTYQYAEIFGDCAPKVSMYPRRPLSASRHTPSHTHRPHHDARQSPGPAAYDASFTQFAAAG